jgi:hypothetical protein
MDKSIQVRASELVKEIQKLNKEIYNIEDRIEVIVKNKNKRKAMELFSLMEKNTLNKTNFMHKVAMYDLLSKFNEPLN